VTRIEVKFSSANYDATSSARTVVAIFIVTFLLLLSLFAPGAFARQNTQALSHGVPNDLPQALTEVGISEKLGQKVDLGLNFKNERGETVSLASYFAGNKPILLSLAYYNCPSLCNFHLNGVNDALKKMNWTVGREFEYLVVSIDHNETPDLAAKKKANYIKEYGRPEGEKGWHFLVGDEASVRALADQVGFGFRWDEPTKQWAHSSAAIVVTPDGTISRYLYGIVFDAQTLRLSLVEAAKGQVGSIVDRLILYCFHFDPSAGKYTLYAFNIMRGGAVLTILVLIAFLLPFWLRQKPAAPSLQGES